MLSNEIKISLWFQYLVIVTAYASVYTVRSPISAFLSVKFTSAKVDPSHATYLSVVKLIPVSGTVEKSFVPETTLINIHRMNGTRRTIVASE